MQTDNVQGDRRRLTFEQQKTLEERVLPTALRWVQTYHPSTSMYQHAKQTLAYWGEA